MLFWVDIETTGLDPDTCKVLEVACVVTDDDLTVRARQSIVLGYDLDVTRVAPVVVEMHTKNGLWDECSKSLLGTTDAEGVFLELLASYALPGTVPMCGSTIGFDRAFLKAHMPKLEKYFSYRNVDVSSFTELAQRWYPGVHALRPQGSGHRALPDILLSIESLKYWRSMVMR